MEEGVMKRVLRDIGIILTGLGLLALCGCASPDVTSIIVGNEMALPEVLDATGSARSIRIFETIKGARIQTSSANRITLLYQNTWTNSYFGIVTTRENLALTVGIEPEDRILTTEKKGK